MPEELWPSETGHKTMVQNLLGYFQGGYTDWRYIDGKVDHSSARVTNRRFLKGWRRCDRSTLRIWWEKTGEKKFHG